MDLEGVVWETRLFSPLDGLRIRLFLKFLRHVALGILWELGRFLTERQIEIGRQIHVDVSIALPRKQQRRHDRAEQDNRNEDQ